MNKPRRQGRGLCIVGRIRLLQEAGASALSPLSPGPSQHRKRHSRSLLPHRTGLGALGQPQEAVDGWMMLQHWSRAGSSPQLTAPTRAGGHPVTLPTSPQMEASGGRWAAPAWLAPAQGSQQLAAVPGPWLERLPAPLGAPEPRPEPRPLLSVSGRRPQMFGKTNCTGISSQLFPQFCPL